MGKRGDGKKRVKLIVMWKRMIRFFGVRTVSKSVLFLDDLGHMCVSPQKTWVIRCKCRLTGNKDSGAWGFCSKRIFRQTEGEEKFLSPSVCDLFLLWFCSLPSLLFIKMSLLEKNEKIFHKVIKLYQGEEKVSKQLKNFAVVWKFCYFICLFSLTSKNVWLLF